MLRVRNSIALSFLLMAVAACSGSKSDEAAVNSSDVDSVVVNTESPTTTKVIEPISFSDSAKQAFGVEMFVDANEFSTSLLAEGLLPMVGPHWDFYAERAELCKGLPLSVYMPLESGDSLEIASYWNVGRENPSEDTYTQDLAISLISGLSEADYQNDITKIRTALTTDLRCETEIFADNGETINNEFAKWLPTKAPYSWPLGVDTGDNGWTLTRFFGFPAEDIICTTKSDSMGNTFATTQVRMGSMSEEDDTVQYGSTMLIYYMPSFELGVVVNAAVSTDQWYGSSGDATVAFDKALALANEFGAKTVASICSFAMAYKQFHDENGYSQFSPTEIPSSSES